MSESRRLLCDTAEALFAELAGQDFAAGWPALMAAGFGDLLVPERQGGFGGDWGDAFAVLRLAGQHALALPLAEIMVARAVLGGAGEGIIGVANQVEGALYEGRFTGTLHNLAWGRHLDGVVLHCDGRLVLLRTADAAERSEGRSIAGEPRDSVRFDAAPVQVMDGPDPRPLAAFARVAQCAGAMDAALAMTVEYVNGRQQFGKPLSKLQAVQQSLAVAASEAAAVNTAGQAAAAALDTGDAALEIAAAKLRCNRAIGIVAAIVHQAHGAIGFTQDYGLHSFTRRLMSWRSDYGGDQYWAMELGRRVTALGADGFWAEITRRSDR